MNTTKRGSEATGQGQGNPRSTRPTNPPSGHSLNPQTNDTPQHISSLSGIPSPDLRPTPGSPRNQSPARKQKGSTTSNPTQSTRARSGVVTPSRAVDSIPSSSTSSIAASQPASSAAESNVSKAPFKLDRPSKATVSHDEGSAADQTQPGSARVKSPPPSAPSSRRSSLGTSSKQPRSGENSPSLQPAQKSVDVPEKQLSPTQSQLRPPRGTSGPSSRLETVEESSPNHHSPLAETLSQGQSKKAANAGSSPAIPQGNETSKPPPNEQKASTDKSPVPPPGPPSRKPSTSSLAPAKTRSTAEGSRHMTVETETVQSIPQAALNPSSERAGSTRANLGGSLRAKPSSDTIRPKKDKKRAGKKPPPIVSGPNSTKAELFEATVASEIDAESTDSDETFVYESNPAEAQPRSRQHSRTPSTTSLAGAGERNRAGLSNRVLTATDYGAERPVRPKRSMKFASNSYAGSSMDDENSDAPHQGTVRHNMRSTPRTDMHHKHVGRLHRDAGHNSDSPLESDSPFSQAQRLRNNTGMGWRSPKGGRSPPSRTTPSHTPTKKGFDSFAMSGTATSDDENAPLLRSVRNPRVRGPHHLRHSNTYYSPSPPRRGCFGSLASCLFLAVALVLILSLGGGFFFATSKALYGVSIMEIENVLASEQEIMLDLLVQAVNPNIAQIAVNDMDINIFAKSSHVADPHDPDDKPKDPPWQVTRKPRWRDDFQREPIRAHDGVDDGTDPDCSPWEPDCGNSGPNADQQTMLLGRIFHFDSPLSFEPSPVRRLSTNSSGELRLARPGNKTESGGSERWERVIKHPFELIVRGILKYQLPLSTRVQTKSVGASVLVHPEEGVDKNGVMHIIQLGRLLPSEEYEGKPLRSVHHESEDEVGIPTGEEE